MARGLLHVENGNTFRRTNATIEQVTLAFRDLLAAYERTGDHDHGNGPIDSASLRRALGPLGDYVIKGDCVACNARRVVALLGHSI